MYTTSVVNEGARRYCIAGFTYGHLPEHWKMWITCDNYEYAGDFWAMIEGQATTMPGAWVPDPVDREYEISQCKYRQYGWHGPAATDRIAKGKEAGFARRAAEVAKRNTSSGGSSSISSGNKSGSNTSAGDSSYSGSKSGWSYPNTWKKFYVP
ncbi:hypothetical protein CGLO_09532 [Colletotrichum gloeosporioides Cg-14]|uniref:Uncharacterized protein n=1 Tax=Colletotrichum gloeosporioides (strain Cg-14) TaxID=1237896 RepID=T0KFZ0_COLGC|nr:hypothetical protein CGLO_09532 [Colletotrichum gloeosporioides Cg-14]